MLRSVLALLLVKLGTPEHRTRENAATIFRDRSNCVERLRRLLYEIYHSGALNPVDASDREQMRLLDIVLAAAEGREFDSLGLPYPRVRAAPWGRVVNLPALPADWVYVAMPASQALLDSGPPYGPE